MRIKVLITSLFVSFSFSLNSSEKIVVNLDTLDMFLNYSTADTETESLLSFALFVTSSFFSVFVLFSLEVFLFSFYIVLPCSLLKWTPYGKSRNKCARRVLPKLNVVNGFKNSPTILTSASLRPPKSPSQESISYVYLLIVILF